MSCLKGSIGIGARDVRKLVLQVQVMEVKGRTFFSFPGYTGAESRLFAVRLGNNGNVHDADWVEF